MKRTLSTIAALGLVGALAGTARADPKLQLDGLWEVPVNQTIVRVLALDKLPGDVNAFGFVDFYGRTSDAFYSEANLDREIYEGLGAKLEWNGGTGMDDVFRFGPNYKSKLHDRLSLDLKLYPLTLGSNGRVQPTGQFSLFGRLDLPEGFYVEDWTDVNVSYERNPDRRVNVQSETTVGKNLAKGLSAEAQVAYNVNVPDEIQGRVGFRYEF